MTDTYTINRTQVAYMLDCDVRTLSTYQKRQTHPLPVAVKGKRGQSHQYDPQAVLKWKVRQEVARLSVVDDGSVLDLEYERARLAKAQADKTERENTVRDGELAPIEALTFAIADFAAQGVAILEGIPKRIKASLPSLRARELKILGTELSKFRKALTSIQIQFDTEGAGDG